MKILSIDPGYERLGIAVIEKEPKQKEILLHSECFKTSSKIPHPERLSMIQMRISEVLSYFRPEILAIETLFFSGNQKTALLVSEARGLIIGTCKTTGLDVFEYGPGQIKLAVTGYGKSDKNAVIKMVKQLISIAPDRLKNINHDDEFDAIAVGLTHLSINPVK